MKKSISDMIELLTWDSEFFGLKIGKFATQTLSEKTCIEVINLKQKHNFDLIYIFCHEIDDAAEALLMQNKGQLADHKITYKQEIDKFREYHPERHINTYEGTLNDDLLHLATSSGQYSRFKKDSRLSGSFEKLYQEWIRKSLTREISDEVFVHQTSGRITGLVTIKNKFGNGQIGLLSVHEDEKGKKIGTNLIIACKAWLKERKISALEVVTQFDNKSACNFYEKNGFTVQSIEKIFHL